MNAPYDTTELTEPFNGERLVALMAALGMSQRDMADVLHIGRRRIREAVAGTERAPPEVEAWWRALETLVQAAPVRSGRWEQTSAAR